MKLIIDISEEEYKFIKMAQNLIIGGRGNCKTIQKDVINAIRNGTLVSSDCDLISRIYVCPFCAHKIQVTEQLLPKVTECEVFGAEIKGDADMRSVDEGLQERAVSDLHTTIDDTYKKLRGEEK